MRSPGGGKQGVWKGQSWKGGLPERKLFAGDDPDCGDGYDKIIKLHTVTTCSLCPFYLNKAGL